MSAAEFKGLLDFIEKLFFAENICFRVFLIPPEGAEGAAVYADVGIIYIPVNDEGNNTPGMQFLPDFISHHAKTEKVGIFEKG